MHKATFKLEYKDNSDGDGNNSESFFVPTHDYDQLTLRHHTLWGYERELKSIGYSIFLYQFCKGLEIFYHPIFQFFLPVPQGFGEILPINFLVLLYQSCKKFGVFFASINF